MNQAPGHMPAGFAPELIQPNEAIGAGIDYVQLLFRFKWLLVLGAIVGVGLGQMGYQKLGPVYESVAQIMVSKKESVLEKGLEAMVYTDRTEHVTLITSPMIVEAAVTKYKLDEIFGPDCCQDVIDGLEVKRSAGNDRSFQNVFDIKFVSRDPADGDRVVAAVIAAYADYLQSNHRENTEDIVDLITQASNKILLQIAAKKAEYHAFRQSAPLIWKNPPSADGQPGDVTNVHQERIIAIEAERRQMIAQRTQITSKLQLLSESIADKKPRGELEAMVRNFLIADGQQIPTAVGVSPATNAMNAQLLPLLLEKQKLERVLGQENPEVQQVQESIDTLMAFFRQRGAQLPTDSKIDDTSFDLVKNYRDGLKQKLEQLDLTDKSLTNQFDIEQAAAKTFVVYHDKDQTFKDEISALKTLQESAETRLNQLTIVEHGNDGYTMRQISPVGNALVFKRHVKFLFAGAFFGAAVVAGIALLREFRDTTIKSVDEIRRRFQLPILGSIPTFQPVKLDATASPAQLKMAPSLCYFHEPGSIAAEAYRSVRAAINLYAETDRSLVIQVSSPEPADGKTTFTCNFAMSLAQSGKKVLLIDADLRRPTIDKLFGTEHEFGLSDILTGDLELVNAVQETPMETLAVLTSGALPQNPAELLSSRRFQSLLEDARAVFDIVLIDSPPLLAVSDPCIVAPHVDGLLMVLRLTKTTRTVAKRAQEIVETHGINVFGVIANGMGEIDGYSNGYGYSSGCLESPKETKSSKQDEAVPVA